MRNHRSNPFAHLAKRTAQLALTGKASADADPDDTKTPDDEADDEAEKLRKAKKAKKAKKAEEEPEEDDEGEDPEESEDDETRAAAVSAAAKAIIDVGKMRRGEIPAAAWSPPKQAKAHQRPAPDLAAQIIAAGKKRRGEA